MTKFQYKRADLSKNSAPRLILTGDLGFGKSTLAALSFPDYLWILTRPSGLQSVAKWIATHPEIAEEYKIATPKNVMVEVNCNRPGKKPDTDYHDWWMGLWDFVEAKKVKGVVIDEASTLYDWIHEANQYRRGPKGNGPREAVADTKSDVDYGINRANYLGIGFVAIHHWQPVVYIGDNATEQKKGKQGDILYPAGPKMPIGTMIRRVSQKFDAVWQLAIDTSMTEPGESGDRVVLTEPSENAIRKRGGFDIPAKIDVPSALAEIDFRKYAELLK